MTHYSVVILQRDAVDSVRTMLAELEVQLERLALPFEIICVDDGSQLAQHEALAALCEHRPQLRLLRFDEPRGTSACLSAGIAAARGELVIAIGAGAEAHLDRLPHLIAPLSQYDLAVADVERPFAHQLRLQVSRPWRAIARRRDLCADELCFWAAPRRVASKFALGRGGFRLLAALAARRGLRVCQLTIAPNRPLRSRPLRPGLLARLAARWVDRPFEPHLASEARGKRPASLWRPFASRSALRGGPAALIAASESKTPDAH